MEGQRVNLELSSSSSRVRALNSARTRFWLELNSNRKRVQLSLTPVKLPSKLEFNSQLEKFSSLTWTSHLSVHGSAHAIVLLYAFCFENNELNFEHSITIFTRSFSGNRHRWTIALSGHHFIAQLILQISNSLPFVIWEQWNFPSPDTRLDFRLEHHINILLLYHKILRMSESDPDIAKCRARRDHTLAHFRTLRITSLTPISQPLLNPIGALRVHGFR